MLVAVGDEAVAALRAAATSAFAAVVLIEPCIPDGEIEALLADVPAAKLVLVRGNDDEAQVDGRCRVSARDRPGRGPAFVGGEALAGETAAMITEATITFAVGVCGDGRRA